MQSHSSHTPDLPILGLAGVCAGEWHRAVGYAGSPPPKDFTMQGNPQMAVKVYFHTLCAVRTT